MSYRTLLAYLPSERTASDVVQAASLLAERHGAHLIGVHVVPPVDLYGPEVPLPDAVVQEYRTTRRAIAAAVRQRFEQGTAHGGFVAEWRRIERVPHSIAHAVAELGDTCDLLVAPRGGDEMSRGGTHEQLLALSARPILLLPRRGPPERLGERVFVAWDGSREASAAVFGALPLLVLADEVRLHRINPPAVDRQHGVGGGEDLAAHLARHGVNVEYAHSDARGGEIAAELLGFATDMGADLVVMGCYGHARLRERLFGGTTRHVLEATELPLLMQG